MWTTELEDGRRRESNPDPPNHRTDAFPPVSPGQQKRRLLTLEVTARFKTDILQQQQKPPANQPTNKQTYQPTDQQTSKLTFIHPVWYAVVDDVVDAGAGDLHHLWAADERSDVDVVLEDEDDAVPAWHPRGVLQPAPRRVRAQRERDHATEVNGSA